MHTVYAQQHLLHATANLLVEGVPYICEEVPERAEILRHAILDSQTGPLIAPTDHGLAPILAVHDPGYVDFLQSAYAEYPSAKIANEPIVPGSFFSRRSRRKPQSARGLLGYYGFGTGSPILEHTWEAAYWSAQCALTAADLVRGGEKSAYALCRPPGHHAAQDLFGGFCYLNNAAIAARHLESRAAILDIDFHHGNGTQEIFYADPTVLYCSLHAHPDLDYPYYWGEACETGEGPGEGTNRNFPMPLGVNDEDYLRVLDKALECIIQFQPRILVVSLGLDIAQGDPVGGFQITPRGFTVIGRRIADLNLPLIIVQEGGYLLDTMAHNLLCFLTHLV